MLQNYISLSSHAWHGGRASCKAKSTDPTSLRKVFDIRHDHCPSHALPLGLNQPASRWTGQRKFPYRKLHNAYTLLSTLGNNEITCDMSSSFISQHISGSFGNAGEPLGARYIFLEFKCFYVHLISYL